ncbi:MAG: RND transporter [marine bacterium B5-7]|nr:MAG: RND transporter [marine bacterium B5-7]
MIPDVFARKFGEWIVSKPWLTIFFSILWVLIAAYGSRFLSFTNDYRVFFSTDNPQLLAFEALEKTYTQFDNVLFVVAPDDHDVFTAETIAALRFLTEESWQIPYSIRVDSLTNFQNSYAEADDLVVEDLVSASSELDADELSRIVEVVRNEPLINGQLVSYDGDVAGVNVTIQLPGLNHNVEVPEVVEAARNLAARFRQKYPDKALYITGVNMLNNAFSEATRHDLVTLIPISFAVIIVLIGIILGRLSGTFITFLIIVMSVVTAMGVAGWADMELTPPSATAPIIILTLAVADSIHILTNFLHKLGDSNSRQEAMVDSLRINMQPVWLTSLTTAIGFLTMNFSDAPPFRDLGNICAVGVLAAFVLSVTFLPAAMMLNKKNYRSVQKRPNRMFTNLAEFIIARRKILLSSIGVVMVSMVVLIPFNTINDQFVEYFDKSIPFRTASDFAGENLVGVYRIEYSLDSKESGGINEPDFMNQVESFSNWYREQPGVQHVSTYTDIMKRLNRNLHGDDPSRYAIPDSRELAAQYLLLYEMSLPYGLDLNDRINVDKSAVRLVVSIENLTVNETLDLEANARQWLDNNAPALTTDGTGPSIMFSHITRRNISTMLIGTTIALVLISALLILALRSVKLGLVSVIPNLMPVAMAFGLWAVIDGEIGLALSVVAAMTLGIVVDDTVHFLSKYLRARREQGLDPANAIRYAFETVGSALLTTSIVLAAGFLVLTFSAFNINAQMGLMTAMTIVIALVVDFFFLPPLLMLIEEHKNA